MGLRRVVPDFRERIWGRTKLSPWFPDAEKKIGEAWFEDGSALLVKFIFTSENLSVQVHPNDTYAREHHGSRGKTEMWHILAAEPGAKIAAGFRRELSEKELREAARSGAIEQLLAWHQARADDTFFIPAGTVHAIGAGLTLCEIQQNSDVTYRLYDYGRGRELHLEQAAAVSLRGPCEARSGDGETLAECEYFVTRQVVVDGSREIRVNRPGFLIAIKGAGQIEGNTTRPGEVWSVEAGPVHLAGTVNFLHASIGGG